MKLRQRDMLAHLAFTVLDLWRKKRLRPPLCAELAPARYVRRPAKLRQRDMFARSALTACDLGREHDSWQCGGRQCRRLIAFVLLAMIVVQIVAFDVENRPFHSTIFAMALSGVVAAAGDQGLHSASSRFARAAYSGLCARASQRRASRIMCRAASG